MPDDSSIINMPDFSNIKNRPDDSNIINRPDELNIAIMPDDSNIINMPDFSNIINRPDDQNIINRPYDLNELNVRPVITVQLYSQSLPMQVQHIPVLDCYIKKNGHRAKVQTAALLYVIAKIARKEHQLILVHFNAS
ncbi:hypothetical protein CHS0354_034458, partial [Potamilus streckersoni]